MRALIRANSSGCWAFGTSYVGHSALAPGQIWQMRVVPNDGDLAGPECWSFPVEIGYPDPGVPGIELD